MTIQNSLEMTFMPSTIQALGANLYATVPPIIAELVANSYDAMATEVLIDLIDNEKSKKITVADNGMGMTFEDINTKFLRIGRNRRHEVTPEYLDTDLSLRERISRRKVIGKKGLGKLSFFGIAKEITVSTKCKGLLNEFTLKLDDILREDNENEVTSNYKPKIISQNVATVEQAGTKITLGDIKRVSDFDSKKLANSLSKIFIFDSDFVVRIAHNGQDLVEVTNEMKYSGVNKEFIWNIPDDILVEDNDDMKKRVSGEVFTAFKPIPKGNQMSGITLFSRTKLVNEPEYFTESTSSHFFTYVTGILSIDYIDELEEEVINTNRQQLNWHDPELEKLRNYLQNVMKYIEKDWRNKRKEAQKTALKKKTEIDIDHWTGTMKDEVRDIISPLITSFEKLSDFPEKIDDASTDLKILHKLIPEYPDYHWRHLHEKLKDVTYDYYKEGNYFTDVCEGVKKYLNELQRKSISELSDRALIENIWSLQTPKLSVVDKYVRENPDIFSSDTIINITQGHRMLVVSIWQAFRCPLSHQMFQDLSKSGLYTDGDCLDALGILPHLFRRLDNSELVNF